MNSNFCRVPKNSILLWVPVNSVFLWGTYKFQIRVCNENPQKPRGLVG